MPAIITCRALGPVELLVNGETAPPDLLWRKHLALIVYLARSPKLVRTHDHLVGLLWAEASDEKAGKSLNQAIHLVRRYAGETSINTDAGQVRLAAGVVDLDTDRFDSFTKVHQWDAAAELVGGHFLEGFGIDGASEFETWLGVERARWRERSVAALVQAGEGRADAGDLTGALGAAHRAIELDAASEPATRLAMKVLMLSGDRAAALQRYEELAAGLERELGTRPDHETQGLADRIRRERTWRPSGSAAAPSAGMGSRRAPLVGRQRELARLRNAWDTCRRERRATLVVISGDSGTGRTRLLEEIVARARLDGASAIVLRAVSSDVGDAGAGVRGWARSGLLDAPGVSAATPSALAAFADWIPEWRDRFAVAVRGVQPESASRALGAVLRAAADEQPIVIACDDAQCLDSDSIGALEAALRDLEHAPLFVVLSQLSRPLRSELDALRARLGRDIAGVAVTLSPLAPAAIVELARWALPVFDGAQQDRLARRVATDTAGLPLLVVELLLAVALGCDIGGMASAWPKPLETLTQTFPGDLPDAIVAALRVNFSVLSRNAQAALRIIAVMGDVERVPAAVVARIAELDSDAVAEALDEAEWQRWVSSDARGYAFVARIVREVIERDQLNDGQRRQIRAAAART